MLSSFLVDDMGWGDSRCYGNEEMVTPNIDKLASQGSSLHSVLCGLWGVFALTFCYLNRAHAVS